MTNEEKILQILSKMDERLTGIEQEAAKTSERLAGIEREVAKTSQRLVDFEQSSSERLTHIVREVAKTNLKIENDITKRLNFLTDGYSLTHEKQYELEHKFERKLDALEKRVEKLEIKAG
jgi:septation ring formation regulator EzrA